jgi:hypothetical protein
MRSILLLILIVAGVSAAVAAAEDEKLKACEKRAYELYPEPNYSPRFGGAGVRDPGGLSQNYRDAMPTLADTERAKQKREQYIRNCLESE